MIEKEQKLARESKEINQLLAEPVVVRYIKWADLKAVDFEMRDQIRQSRILNYELVQDRTLRQRLKENPTHEYIDFAETVENPTKVVKTLAHNRWG